jgi:hypothetical protein
MLSSDDRYRSKIALFSRRFVVARTASAASAQRCKLSSMWADTLQAAEKAHLMRVLVWALFCVLTGTAVLAVFAVRRWSSALSSAFAIQTIGWGVFEATVALVALVGLAPRDLSAAARLDQHLWFETGLDVGLIAIGVTLALTTYGLTQGRRLGGVGAGLGIIVQGAVLLVLDAHFLALVNRFV